ncbi:MAG: hypothetical protein KIS92_13690 [Planctomycetota bacterium]|nr:hypothetical protein [Planctomycetota bacterium]
MKPNAFTMVLKLAKVLILAWPGVVWLVRSKWLHELNGWQTALFVCGILMWVAAVGLGFWGLLLLIDRGGFWSLLLGFMGLFLIIFLPFPWVANRLTSRGRIEAETDELQQQ